MASSCYGVRGAAILILLFLKMKANRADTDTNRSDFEKRQILKVFISFSASLFGFNSFSLPLTLDWKQLLQVPVCKVTIWRTIFKKTEYLSK